MQVPGTLLRGRRLRPSPVRCGTRASGGRCRPRRYFGRSTVSGAQAYPASAGLVASPLFMASSRDRTTGNPIAGFPVELNAPLPAGSLPQLSGQIGQHYCPIRADHARIPRALQGAISADAYLSCDDQRLSRPKRKNCRTRTQYYCRNRRTVCRAARAGGSPCRETRHRPRSGPPGRGREIPRSAVIRGTSFARAISSAGNMR